MRLVCIRHILRIEAAVQQTTSRYNFSFFRKLTRLPKHLMKVHKWSHEKACRARLEYNLNLPHSTLSNDERITKSRTYTKRRCPITFCQKVVVRLENHLKDQHGLKGDLYKKKLKEAEVVSCDAVKGDLSGAILVEKGLLHAEALDECNEESSFNIPKQVYISVYYCFELCFLS